MPFAQNTQRGKTLKYEKITLNDAISVVDHLADFGINHYLTDDVTPDEFYTRQRMKVSIDMLWEAVRKVQKMNALMVPSRTIEA